MQMNDREQRAEQQFPAGIDAQRTAVSRWQGAERRSDTREPRVPLVWRWGRGVGALEDAVMLPHKPPRTHEQGEMSISPR